MSSTTKKKNIIYPSFFFIINNLFMRRRRKSVSRSRSRSLSPLNDNDKFLDGIRKRQESWSCQHCRQCIRIIESQNQIIQRLTKFTEGLSLPNTISSSSSSSSSSLTSSSSSSSTSSTSSKHVFIIYVLGLLNTCSGYMHIIPWVVGTHQRYYVVNAYYVLYLCRLHFPHMKWYMKDIRKILKSKLNGVFASDMITSKLIPYALTRSTKHVLMRIDPNYLQEELKLIKHIQIEPITVDVMDVCKISPRTNKLIYTSDMHHTAIGCVPTQEHLKQLYAIPEVANAFGGADDHRHFRLDALGRLVQIE